MSPALSGGFFTTGPLGKALAEFTGESDSRRIQNTKSILGKQCKLRGCQIYVDLIVKEETLSHEYAIQRGDSTSSDYSVAKTQEDNFVRVQIYKKCSKFYYFRGQY